MFMCSIEDEIKRFNNDENVIALKKYYNEMSFGNVMGFSRNEIYHSNFFKWLFDPLKNFDLGSIPLELFLNLLFNKVNKIKSNVSFNSLNIYMNTRNNNKLVIDNVRGEYPNGWKQKDGRTDLYISFHFEDYQEKFAIILENKVESVESKKGNKYQTEVYADYYKMKSKEDNTKYIFVFLAPYFYKKSEAKSKDFINITYDNIMEFLNIIQSKNINAESNFIINSYMNILRMPNVYKLDCLRLIEGYGSEKEKELIEKIKNSGFDKTIENLDDCNVIKFLQDITNKTMVSVIWPNVLKKRCDKVTFEKLGIKSGTKLYLSATSGSTEIFDKKLFVVVADEKSNVYLNGEKMSISKAAKEFNKDRYNFDNYRGISWFIYKNRKGTIIYNLLRRYEDIKKI